MLSCCQSIWKQKKKHEFDTSVGARVPSDPTFSSYVKKYENMRTQYKIKHGKTKQDTSSYAVLMLGQLQRR